MMTITTLACCSVLTVAAVMAAAAAGWAGQPPAPAYAAGGDGAGTWRVGGSIVPGSSFAYAVCDGTVTAGWHHNRWPAGTAGGPDDGLYCYELLLDFYVELQSGGRGVWVVQARAEYGGGGPDDDGNDAGRTAAHHVFLMDSHTMEIATDPAGRDLAGSVDRTLLYLDGFAHAGAPRPLETGAVWGTVASSSLNIGNELVVAGRADAVEIGNRTLDDAYVLEYGLLATSTATVSAGLPFPVSATFYDPRWTLSGPPAVFDFRLVDFFVPLTVSPPQP